MFKLLIFLSGALFLSCNSTKTVTEKSSEKDLPASECKTAGVITDMSGIDGCQKMIETKDGKKYIVFEGWPSDIDMQTGLEIMFNFEIVPDIMSICMAESGHIRITCLEVTGAQNGRGKPEKPECFDTKDPLSVKWMKEAVYKHEPVEIKKYNYEDGWAYYLTGGPVSYLYDCQGNLMCEVPGRIFNDCVKLIGTLGQGTVIWVQND
jgi:hypothetical protein